MGARRLPSGRAGCSALSLCLPPSLLIPLFLPTLSLYPSVGLSFIYSSHKHIPLPCSLLITEPSQARPRGCPGGISPAGRAAAARQCSCGMRITSGSMRAENNRPLKGNELLGSAGKPAPQPSILLTRTAAAFRLLTRVRAGKKGNSPK